MSDRPTIYGFCAAGCKYPLRDIVTKEVSLSAAGWSGNEQSVTVEEMDGTCDVIVSPKPTNAEAYNKAGVQCIAQNVGTLTFSCSTIPKISLTVNLLIVRGTAS